METWKDIETAPRDGTWFLARTKFGTTKRCRFADEYDRLPLSGDGTSWSTLPLEWTPLFPAEWSEEDLELIDLIEPFDKALFLSGCSQHKLHSPGLDGYVVTEEKLLKFVNLYNKFSKN